MNSRTFSNEINKIQCNDESEYIYNGDSSNDDDDEIFLENNDQNIMRDDEDINTNNSYNGNLDYENTRRNFLHSFSTINNNQLIGSNMFNNSINVTNQLSSLTQTFVNEPIVSASYQFTNNHQPFQIQNYQQSSNNERNEKVKNLINLSNVRRKRKNYDSDYVPNDKEDDDPDYFDEDFRIYSAVKPRRKKKSKSNHHSTQNEMNIDDDYDEKVRNVKEHYCGKMINCGYKYKNSNGNIKFCNTPLFYREKYTKKDKLRKWCCGGGKKIHNPLKPLPKDIQKIIKIPNFTWLSRRVNNMLKFGTLNFDPEIGVGGEGIITRSGLSSLTLNGRAVGKIWQVENNQLIENRNGNFPHYLIHDKDNFDFVYKKQGDNYVKDSTSSKFFNDIYKVFKRQNSLYKLFLTIQDRINDGEKLYRVMLSRKNNDEIAVVYNAMRGVPKYFICYPITKSYNTATLISSYSRLYGCLMWPLLYSDKDDSYFVEGKEKTRSITGHPMTRREYVKSVILRESRLKYMGKLKNEFIVVEGSKILDDRIDHLENKQQSILRKYEISDKSTKTGTSYSNLGTIVPSNFTGSKKWLQAKLSSLIELTKRYGNPHIFMTITTNPQWKEIRENIIPGSEANLDVDIAVRVAQIKFEEIIGDITNGKIFGSKCSYWIIRKEYQKRGLLHMHCLFRFKDYGDILPNSFLDKYLSGVVPDPIADPKLNEIILRNQVHEHYDKCKHKKIPDKLMCGFPKMLTDESIVDKNGVYHLKRFKPEDQKIPDYCPYISKRINGHGNVQAAHAHTSKYCLKYLTKDSNKYNDFLIQTGNLEKDETEINEIKRMVYYRYLSASQSVNNVIFANKEIIIKPAVMRLHLHLPTQKRVYIDISKFNKNHKRQTELNRSQLEQYLDRPKVPHFEKFTYVTFFENFNVALKNDLPKGIKKNFNFRLNLDDSHPKKCWKLKPRFVRLDKKTFGIHTQLVTIPLYKVDMFIYKLDKPRICSLDFLPRVTGEMYFFRILVDNFPSFSFEEYRTVYKNNENKIVDLPLLNNLHEYSKTVFKFYSEAAIAKGVYSSFNESALCMIECIENFKSSFILRSLFVQSLNQEGSNARELFNRFLYHLVEDFERQYSPNFTAKLNNQNYSVPFNPDHQLNQNSINKLLVFIKDHLPSGNMNHYGLPNVKTKESLTDKLISTYQRDKQILKQYLDKYLPLLNNEQLYAFNITKFCIQHSIPITICLIAKSGRGKSVVLKCLQCWCVLNGFLPLICSYTGNNASRFPCGITCHNAFGWPCDYEGIGEVILKLSKQKADRLKKVNFIGIDEISQIQKAFIDSLSKCLKNLETENYYKNFNFGSKVVFLTGDILQTHHVLINSTPLEIINSSIIRSFSYAHSLKLILFSPIRDNEDLAFSKFNDEIGLGVYSGFSRKEEQDLIKTYNFNNNIICRKIKLPSSIINYTTLQEAMNFVHPDIENTLQCSSNVFLCFRNSNVNMINNKYLNAKTGEILKCIAVERCKKDDCKKKNDPNGLQQDHLKRLDFATIRTIGSYKQSGVPNHELLLKRGALGVLLRNVDFDNGLTNGCKIKIQDVFTRVVTFYKIEDIKNKKNPLPLYAIRRYTFPLKVKDLKTDVYRLQFPVSLAYSATVHRFQGETINKSCLYLVGDVWTHGLLYTSGTRGKTFKNLTTFCNIPSKIDDSGRVTTLNIVYKDLIDYTVYSDACFNDTTPWNRKLYQYLLSSYQFLNLETLKPLLGIV